MQHSFLLAYKSAFLLLIILFGLLAVISACEKDDICVDGDTPLLVIRFYDIAQPDQSKAVEKLRVLGLGQDSPVNTFADRSNLDSISLPLRSGESETTFILILDSQEEEGSETGNADTLRFDYQTREVFVSKACGFIANYVELESQLQSTGENWIQNIEILNATIKTQDSAHVSIFH